MYLIQVVSATPYSLQAMSLKWLSLWKWWTKCMFQGQGRRWGNTGCLDRASGSTNAHVFSMTSNTVSLWPKSICSLLKKNILFFFLNHEPYHDLGRIWRMALLFINSRCTSALYVIGTQWISFLESFLKYMWLLKIIAT